MSAEPVSAVPGPQPAASPCHGRPVQPVMDVLADGTPCYAPVGEVVTAGGLMLCHLCGRPFRSVSAHVRVHGWTTEGYRQAFGLERGQSLEGPETRKRRAALASWPTTLRQRRGGANFRSNGATKRCGRLPPSHPGPSPP